MDALLEAAAKREELVAVRDFLELGNAYLDVLLEDDLETSRPTRDVHEALTSDEKNQNETDRIEVVRKALAASRHQAQ